MTLAGLDCGWPSSAAGPTHRWSVCFMLLLFIKASPFPILYSVFSIFYRVFKILNTDY